LGLSCNAYVTFLASGPFEIRASSYIWNSDVWRFGDGFWLIATRVVGGGQAASAGGRAGIGAAASYCQMPRNRPPPQYLSCWQTVIELWREVNMQMVFGSTNSNGIFSPTSPEWGIPNPGRVVDNGLRCNSSQCAKVRGLLQLLIEQVIPLRKPLMRLIEPKFTTVFGTTLRDKLS
jgi:hypothetical protein